MKPLIKFAFFIIFSIFLVQTSTAQYLASSYQPKNKTERVILAKIRTLPEVKEWFKTAKNSKPDLIVNKPDSVSGRYSIQVGISNLDMFRTNYYLYIDPKTYKIFFWDELDEKDDGIITLEQWRYWRTKPGFQKLHYYKNGKLIVSELPKHDKKKGR